MDRNTLEKGRAYVQTLNDFTKRLTRLEQRSWPGAARTAKLDEFTGMSADYQTALTLTVSSGKWVLFHRGYCTLTTATMGASANLISRTPVGEVMRTPLIFGFNPGSGTFPVADFAVISNKGITVIELGALGTGFTTAVWTDLSLVAIPV